MMRSPTEPLENTLLGLCAVGGAFFVPIGIAPFNGFVILASLAWLIWVARAPARLGGVLREPVVQGALALFALYAVSVAWSEAPRREAWAQLNSYRVLLLPVVFLPVLAHPLWRARTLNALLAGLGVVLVLSCLQWLHPLPFARASQDVEGQVFRDAYVFSDRIRQNIHLSVFVLWSAGGVLNVDADRVLCLRQGAPRWRWAMACSRRAGYGVLLLATLLNVLWLVKGRTAWLVVSALAVYAFVTRFGRRGWMLGVVWCVVAALAVWMGSSWLGVRMAATVTEAREYLGGGVSNATGVRLDMWRHAWTMIQAAPWLGHGIESYPSLSERILAATGQARSFLHHDPHQEWVYVVELGLVGVLVLAAGLIGVWRIAGRFDAQWRWLARGFVVIYLAAGLVNGLLNLAWTGYFFGLLLALVAGRHAQGRSFLVLGGDGAKQGLRIERECQPS
jgi:O-antigen ligase